MLIKFPISEKLKGAVMTTIFDLVETRFYLHKDIYSECVFFLNRELIAEMRMEWK